MLFQTVLPMQKQKILMIFYVVLKWGCPRLTLNHYSFRMIIFLWSEYLLKNHSLDVLILLIYNISIGFLVESHGFFLNHKKNKTRPAASKNHTSDLSLRIWRHFWRIICKGQFRTWIQQKVSTHLLHSCFQNLFVFVNFMFLYLLK